MPVLDPSEYDMSYFDGRKGPLKHNAGYAKYERWARRDSATSLGEKWLDKAAALGERHQLQNKKVLEIGCAKGFLVKDLRDMGVDAYGLDVSPYAIGEAEDGMAPHLYTGDARTYLSNFSRNEFDVVFSLRFLECIAEADLPGLVSEMNRISKLQFHEIDVDPNPDYYVVQPLSWWASLDWDRRTLLVARETGEEVVL
jgi:predicted TPR repeat methyltransferase